MKTGTFTYYKLQHRVVAKSPWLKPDGKLKPEENEWDFSSHDSFGWAFNSLSSKGVRKHRNQFDDIHSTWEKTGEHGWTKLKNATQALALLQEQAVRYQFRLMKVTASREEELV